MSLEKQLLGAELWDNLLPYPLRDGIVSWELQEQKCQQRVRQHTDVL